MQQVLSIGEVAARAGLATSALRHYEAEGLLPSNRDGAGRRIYHRGVLRRIAFIRAAQAVGMSLQEIRRALASLPGHRTPNQTDWARLAKDWERRLDERIEALVALKAGLTSCIGCGCLSLSTCALANPADVSATYGAGARYLPSVLRASRPTADPRYDD